MGSLLSKWVPLLNPADQGEIDSTQGQKDNYLCFCEEAFTEEECDFGGSQVSNRIQAKVQINQMALAPLRVILTL